MIEFIWEFHLTEQIDVILNQYQITNPIDLLKVYCDIKIGRSIRPLKKLYTNVFQIHYSRQYQWLLQL